MRPTPAMQCVLYEIARRQYWMAADGTSVVSRSLAGDAERRALREAIDWLGARTGREWPPRAYPQCGDLWFALLPPQSKALSAEGQAALARVYEHMMKDIQREEVLDHFQCDWGVVFRAAELLADWAGVHEEERWLTATRLNWTLPATLSMVRVLGSDIEFARVVEVLRAKPHPVFEVRWSPLISHFRFIQVDEASFAAQEPSECLDWPVIVGRDQGRRIPLVGWRHIEKARAEGSTYVPACLLTVGETRAVCNLSAAPLTAPSLFQIDGPESQG